MRPLELLSYYGKLGTGGKIIGGAHENFGIGGKTSTLPWNPFGVVIISYVDGEGSMIWIYQDPKTGMYGLRRHLVPYEREDGSLGHTMESVYSPYNDPQHGCDWRKVRPGWIKDHGTVVVLLGRSSKDDTWVGDPNKNEKATKGLTVFLNSRLWEIPAGVRLEVDHHGIQDKRMWTRDTRVKGARVVDGKQHRWYFKRELHGAKKFVVDPPWGKQKVTGRISSSGTLTFSCKSELDWYLWEGDRPKVHQQCKADGYIAYLYQNELYSLRSYAQSFKAMGIVPKEVRNRLFLVIRPFVDPKGKVGVFPRGDRGELQWKDSNKGVTELPFPRWSSEFAGNMPEEILQALKDSHRKLQVGFNDDLRDEILSRLGEHREYLVEVPGGGPGKPPPDGPGPSGGKKGQGGRTGTRRERVKLGVPPFLPVGDDDVEGWLGDFVENHPQHEEGCLMLNIEHQFIVGQTKYWCDRCDPIYHEKISALVIECYGVTLCARLSHAFVGLRNKMTESELKKLLTPEFITVSACGLYPEDKVIRHLAEKEGIPLYS
jgi:hypothetical protein